MLKPIKPKRILFATDFSRYSEEARAWALGIAQMSEASVVVLHVIDFVDTSDDPPLRNWFDRLRAKAAYKLDEEADRFRRAGIEAYTKLAVGSPSETIVEKADEAGAELIVIGSHGVTTRDGRVLLGTTSHRLALGARLPVLIVKTEREEST